MELIFSRNSWRLVVAFCACAVRLTPAQPAPIEQASYPVSGFTLRYGREHANLPALREIASVEGALSLESGVYVETRSAASIAVWLDAIGGDVKRYAESALRQMSAAIVRKLNDRGLYGITANRIRLQDVVTRRDQRYDAPELVLRSNYTTNGGDFTVSGGDGIVLKTSPGDLRVDAGGGAVSVGPDLLVTQGGVSIQSAGSVQPASAIAASSLSIVSPSLTFTGSRYLAGRIEHTASSPSARLTAAAVRSALGSYHALFNAPSRVGEIQQTLTEVLHRYNEGSNGDIDSIASRAFVDGSSEPEAVLARAAIDHLGTLFQQIEDLGLTSKEEDISKPVLLRPLRVPGLSEAALRRTIERTAAMSTAQPAAESDASRTPAVQPDQTAGRAAR